MNLPFSPDAAGLLRTLREMLGQAIDATAHLCAPDGRLQPELLDRHQVASYEIALAAADLLAAETCCALEDACDVDARLARLFIADAAVAVIGRLEGLFLELGLDAGALRALSAGEQMQALRAGATGSESLSSLGADVLRADSLAQVPLDEELVMARESFERFAAQAVAPLAAAIHRQDLTVPESLLQPLREMGVFGLSIPQEFGGSATGTPNDALMMIAVTEALSEASLGAAGSLITRPEILARALLEGGTPAQKDHWLPKIAAGDPLCAIAMTEPDYGSDVAGLMLAATRAPGGWRLNGAKTWCTFAGKAGLLMVVARTGSRADGHRGLSLMLAEKPSSEAHEFSHTQSGGGRLDGRAIPTIGYRGMHSYDLSFTDFFVPDANVIGEASGLGKGFYFTMAGMVGGRMQTAARACGVMRAAIGAAVRYAQDRKVFGTALGNFPLTQARIARMASRYAACRWLAYAVGRRLGHGGAAMEASLAKLLACRCAEGVTRDALQLHGGMGYAQESAVSRYFVDARVLSIFEGAEETLALKVVAKSLFEDALARG